MKEIFRRFAAHVAYATGTALAFTCALIIIVVWALSGPIFHFSNTWQLVINTGTTIVTLLMVFLIQNTQNRVSQATQLKLDELIRSSSSARQSFLDLEDLTDEDLFRINEQFKQLHASGVVSSGSPIHRLHTKISAEHQRRLSAKSKEHNQN